MCVHDRQLAPHGHASSSSAPTPCPQSAAAGEPLPGAVARPAMLCQLLVLAWRLRGLGSDEEAEPAGAAADLSAKRGTLLAQLEAIAAATDSAAVKDEVGGCCGPGLMG